MLRCHPGACHRDPVPLAPVLADGWIPGASTGMTIGMTSVASVEGHSPVTSDQDIFDRALLVQRRDRVAAGAGAHDFLLARVADDLIERLAAVQRRFPVALDLGAYHGLLGRRLRQVPAVEMVVDAAAALGLLEQCGCPRVQADEEALPFRNQSLDLVVSGL